MESRLGLALTSAQACPVPRAWDLEIVSYGGGVQTTALAILNLTGQIAEPARRIVFADTGGEHPETYSYVRVFADWIRDHGGEFVEVRYGDLYWDYYERQLIPYRTLRRCTDKYKIRPVRRYLRERVGRRKSARVRVQLGISVDEARRAVPSDVAWAENRYPLIEKGLSRRDCVDIIVAHGLPVPPKSGCFYCPFQGKKAWNALRQDHPTLFEAAVHLEARAAASKPGVYLHGRHPLSDLPAIPDGAFEWNEAEGECSTGYCFT